MNNIVFLHSSSELYGSDRSLLNLVKNLNKDKFNITVILPEDGPLVDKINSFDNVEVIINELAVLRRKNLSLSGMSKYFIELMRSIKFINNLIKEKNIDIVYTNTSVIFVGGISAKICKVKSVWHIREIIKSKYERFIVSKIVNIFSDYIIANSKATAEAISKNKDKVKVVYNAIDIEKNSDLEDIDEFYKEVAATIVRSNNKIKIGMAGRINRWKGQKLFVDMAKLVSEENDNVEFLIAGDVYKGEDYILDNLKGYILESGVKDKIGLLGQVDNMSNFYKKLDIFVLPSIQPEPFGLVVIEAMNNKLPVVATNHGGPVEIIDNNIDGFLVDYKDAREMAQVVNKLIKDKELRNYIAANGEKKVKEKFNISRYVDEISYILEEF
ncbi:glycosyltransferase family 4 protein [Clostridium cuniculi]|uniref:glycosyltransferase family 4 protein n=1 Tax=Clostridium cuniculi TaxID=2548455 RepID=UPI00140FE13E|nr:glycosyltransferase family 4 protein [Clostridium cuniculi]